MRRVFSSAEMPEVVLVRDALLHDGIAATIQNQHSGFTAVPAFRPPAEVWVHDDHVEEARTIVRQALSRMDSAASGEPWPCTRCKEVNPPAFETCWSCGTAKA